MTTETLEEAVQAAKISLAEFHEAPVLVNFGEERKRRHFFKSFRV